MKITITNKTAFRLAHAAADPKNRSTMFRGVRLSPDGGVTGTDGFRIAHHPHGVEPFEGEPVMVKLDKAPPAGDAGDWIVDTDTRILEAGSKRITCEVWEGKDYVPFEHILPNTGVAPMVDVMGVNARYLHDFAKVASRDSHAVWQFTARGADGQVMLSMLTGDKNQVALLVPLRDDTLRSPILRATVTRSTLTSPSGNIPNGDIVFVVGEFPINRYPELVINEAIANVELTGDKAQDADAVWTHLVNSPKAFHSEAQAEEYIQTEQNGYGVAARVYRGDVDHAVAHVNEDAQKAA